MRTSLFAVRAPDSFPPFILLHLHPLLIPLRHPEGSFFIHGYPEIDTNYLTLQITVEVPAFSVMDTATTLRYQDQPPARTHEPLYQERTSPFSPGLLFKTAIHPDKKPWRKAINREIQNNKKPQLKSLKTKETKSTPSTLLYLPCLLFKTTIHLGKKTYDYNPLPPKRSRNEEPQA
jgi:hypothetical protein